MEENDTGQQIDAAIEDVCNYVGDVTGKRATKNEVAAALKKYFVLNEIKDFIVLMREEQ